MANAIAPEKDPSTRGPAQLRLGEAVKISRDCFEGPLKIKTEGRRYLPQFPKESSKAWENRLNRSVFYDAFTRTVKGLTGMVCREPPKLAEKMPEQISKFWENVDLAGTHGQVFFRRCLNDGEVDGIFVVFVEFQPIPTGARSRADTNGRMPYLVQIKAENVVAADDEIINGQSILTHFRYRECVTERVGYAYRDVEFIREYNLMLPGTSNAYVEYTLHKKKAGGAAGDEWVIDKTDIMMIDEIPVVCGYIGDKDGTFSAPPPLLSLALENLAHYELDSDYRNVLHLTCVPIYVRIGLVKPLPNVGGQSAGGTGQPRPAEEAVGPTVGVDLPLNGDAKYVEPQGNGLQATAARIEKSEYRMAMLGLSMLMSDTRAAETATSKRIDKAESDSALSDHARASQDAWEEILRLAAKWLDIEAQMPVRSTEARWLSVNRNFEDVVIDPQIARVLADLVAAGRLTQETMWAALVRGRVLPENFDAKLEAELLTQREEAEVEEAMQRMKVEGETSTNNQIKLIKTKAAVGGAVA
jgi:hypothetical protein